MNILRIVKPLLFLFIAFYCATLRAADSYGFWGITIEGVYMHFNVISETEKTCRVIGSVYSPHYAAINIGTEGTITIPANVNGYSVIHIGSNAFYECKKVTNVIIPNSVTTIGDGAFYKCTSLTSITLPRSVTSIGEGLPLSHGVFFGCTALKSITIPNSVKSIVSSAFEDCTSLTNITIPNSVTSIGGSAFRSCTGLTSITIPNSVKSIANHVFANCSGLTSVTIPNSVTSIGDYAFYGCSGLTSITIPNSVTSIGDYAFRNCSGLIKITIPNSVISIGSSAFSDCSGLTSITIPNSVTSIGDYAFRNCSGLIKITIPSSVTNIGSYAFEDCTAMTNIFSFIKDPFAINENVFPPLIKTEAILNVPLGCKEQYENTMGWKDFANILEIENKVGDYFTAKTKENVDMKFQITDLESWKCQVSSSLDNKAAVSNDTKGALTIPTIAKEYTVTGIGSSAFMGCQNITSVFIPSTVTTIANSAFSGCTGLGSITVDATNTVYDSRDNSNALIETKTNTLLVGSRNTVIPASVTTIGERAFYGITGLTSITLPATLKNIRDEAFAHTDCLDSVRSGIMEPFAIPTSVFVHSDGRSPVLYIPWNTKEKYLSIGGWSQFNKVLEVAPFSGYEFSAEYDGILLRFKVIDRDTRTCQVGLGEPDEAMHNAMHITIPREVRDQTVTAVSYRAFANCTELLSISFPETVTEAGNHVLDGCGCLAAIRWDANVKVPAGLTEDVDNPNLLLYVKDNDYAPSGIQNVVADGVAESIVLKEAASGNNFYCTEQFTAKRITYTHRYSMTSGYKECQGWETIALPFDVATITNESDVELTPIMLWERGSIKRPFWLYEQTTAGWQKATAIKANTPYIICMPNNTEHYEPSYCITGNVTFTATDATVPPSDLQHATSHNGRTFVPAFQYQQASSSVYALNADNEWEHYDYTTYLKGSTFLPNLRAVHPFEAYMTTEENAAPAFIPVFDDATPTGIDNALMPTIDRHAVSHCYNLNGQRVEKPMKGIYVINGKKVVVK